MDKLSEAKRAWVRRSAAGLVASLCWVVGVAGAEDPELIRLIDCPTAGVLDKGSFGLDLRLCAGGGVLGQVTAGVVKRLTIGISYGGERLIGNRGIEWYPRVEAAARYRLVEESPVWPALVLGYETQGYGAYRSKRYQIKSKGAYVVLSKNYLSPLGQFGVHAGGNLSRETGDGDEDPSAWVGVDKSLNEDLSLVAEYDLALNDDSNSSPGTGTGYLNLGARASVGSQVSVCVYLKDVLGNGRANPDPSRELAVVYTENF